MVGSLWECEHSSKAGPIGVPVLKKYQYKRDAALCVLAVAHRMFGWQLS